MVLTIAPLVVADAPADRLAGMRADLAQVLGLGSEAWSYDGWPGRPRTECHPLRGQGYDSLYEDLWCAECTVKEEACRAAFRFYPDPGAGTCTVQEVQVDLGMADGVVLAPLGRVIEARLGQSTMVASSDVSESGCASWTEIRRWRGTHDLAYLYLDDHSARGRLPVGDHAAGFLWRRSPLMELQDEYPDEPPRHDDPQARAAAACRDAGIAECETVMSALGEQRALVAATHAALDTLERLSPSSPRAAPLAYWLKFLAGDESHPLVSGDSSERERLARRGVVYVEGYDGMLILKTQWLRNLAERHPRSKWGQQAFLEMIRHHYGDDDAGGDAFRPVIVHGEAFLREHPGSDIEADLSFELALAYETWWSLSKADPADERHDDVRQYSSGADQARRRAIALYRRFRPRDAHERIWLEQRLFRLERDIDTDQRAYDWSGC